MFAQLSLQTLPAFWPLIWNPPAFLWRVLLSSGVDTNTGHHCDSFQQFSCGAIPALWDSSRGKRIQLAHQVVMCSIFAATGECWLSPCKLHRISSIFGRRSSAPENVLQKALLFVWDRSPKPTGDAQRRGSTIVAMSRHSCSRKPLEVQTIWERLEKSLYTIFIPCFKAGLECYIFHIGAESFIRNGNVLWYLILIRVFPIPAAQSVLLVCTYVNFWCLTSIFGASDITILKSTVRVLIQQDKIDNFYDDTIITGSIKELLHFFKPILFLALTLQWHIGWQYPWYYFKIPFNHP